MSNRNIYTPAIIALKEMTSVLRCELNKPFNKPFYN